MKKKSVTISDIAERLGVSKTTVSFAFNCPSRISKEMAEKVYALAKELGYVHASSSKTASIGYHKTIGLLLPQTVDNCLSNPYMLDVIRGAACVCAQYGFTMNLIPPFLSSISVAVKNASVDGLITLGIAVTSKVVDSFGKKDVPMVSIDGIEDGAVVSVGIDEESASYQQMSHVLENGHRSICILTLPDTLYPSVDKYGSSALIGRRLTGYGRALLEYGMELSDTRIVSAPVSFDSNYRFATDFLSQGEDAPTCFVCMSDIAAMAAYRACMDMKINVPEDVSIIGFDGIVLGGQMVDGLTTIYQDGDEKGRLAAKLIFKMLKGDCIESRTNHIPFSFIEGGTLAACKC